VKIDNRVKLSLAAAPSRQLPQHVFRQHIATEEFRAFLHQSEQGFFSLDADQRYVSEVND